jgi:hypothetical protein
MNGIGVQPFGGEEFEDAVTQHINRANLGHHIGGDQDNDPIEPLLARAAIGH